MERAWNDGKWEANEGEKEKGVGWVGSLGWESGNVEFSRVRINISRSANQSKKVYVMR